ncbi:hypothetical protein C4Z68_05010 [Clostridioides difficile]
MIVYDLKQTGLRLKMELQNDSSSETAKKIALEIENATYSDGTPLTSEEKGHLIKYIEFPAYDHKTGRFALQHADNSEFLKLVALISKSVNGQK